MEAEDPAGAFSGCGQATSNRYQDPESTSIMALLSRHAIGPLLIARAAEKQGAVVSWQNRFMFSAVLDGVGVFFWDVRSNESAVGARIATNKSLTRKFLATAGAPVPAGEVVRTEAEALAFWERVARPIVLKPLKGTKGRDVALNLDDAESIARAFRRAFSERGVIAEAYLVGREARFLVVGGEVVAVLGKDAPHVVGDGMQTIRELVAEKNALRQMNPRLCTSPLQIDEGVLSLLARGGRSAETVVSPGEKVYLRGEANIALGADTVDLTDGVSEAVKAIAVKAVQAIPGLDWAGLDILFLEGEPDREEVAILEINTDPGIGGHHFPMYGAPRDVASVIWRRAFEKQKALANRFLEVTPRTLPGGRRQVSVRIRGEVQGVGFRRWIRRAAHRLALEGWVRNRSDGSVETVLSGLEAAVERMIGLLHFGPRQASVKRVHVVERQTPVRRAGFSILKTR